MASLILLTKLDMPPLLIRSKNAHSPTLHRLWYGGSTEEERWNSEGIASLLLTLNGKSGFFSWDIQNI